MRKIIAVLKVYAGFDAIYWIAVKPWIRAKYGIEVKHHIGFIQI